MMDIQLPPRIDGGEPPVLKGARQITIIGANGSGKSRFCSQLVKSCGDKAYRISALRALFPMDDERQAKLPGSIADMFDRINASTPQVTNTASTEFDKLTYVMLTDEFRDLMNYKAHLLMGEEMPFPKNKVLRENGKLLFTTEGQSDKYSSLRLSDGEKAVLYYIGAVLYAMPDAVIVVDDPETFIHRSIMQTLWNVIEEMRPDCSFIYNTHNVEFASSRVDNQCVWVKNFDPEHVAWDYEVMPSSQSLDDAIYFELLGSRKPVLFIEGDETHSIDSKLYPLIFPDYTVKPLGSCNRVIETVRSFGNLRTFHQLDSYGIVDRDRRSEEEVEYLRKKNIFVPDVAEIENMLLIEGVVRSMAHWRKRNADEVFGKVRRSVMNQFSREIKSQALMHTRHRVKHDVELRIDMKFRNIGALEDHMLDLVNEINPRGYYEDLCRLFHRYAVDGDYRAVLRVFNQKTMLSECNVAGLCGYARKEDYVKGVLTVLKAGGKEAREIRDAIKACLAVPDGEA